MKYQHAARVGRLSELSGGTVYAFRKLKRWTQKEAAEWYGVSERTWRRYETGEIVCLPLLKRIANPRAR
jgi:transcriptional regulator with XRE-family HTH domain